MSKLFALPMLITFLFNSRMKNIAEIAYMDIIFNLKLNYI